MGGDKVAKRRSREEFDHTGDLGIEVEAESLAGVFEEAALGMFGLLTDLDTISQETAVDVSLSAEDARHLLYDWLSELNFLHLTERLLFGRFDISHVSDKSIKATAIGQSIDLRRHRVHTEIKAVTHHDMVVEQRNDTWYARIIFDI